MSASPSIRQKGVCNHEGAMRSDFSSILELISGLSLDEAGQNHAELWKKMCFLIISMVEKTEQHPSTIKPATGSTTEKDIHSKKTTAKGRAQRPGGRLPRSHSDNEDEERDGRKKRKLSTDHDDAEIRKLRLKCPFYLRHPEKHRRGSCRGEGFADMGKLKWVHIPFTNFHGIILTNMTFKGSPKEGTSKTATLYQVLEGDTNRRRLPCSS